MNTTEQDEKCPIYESRTPRTDEAVERWQQGKVNLIEEMSKMELEIYGLQDQLQVAMWCLDKAKERANKYQSKNDKLLLEISKETYNRRKRTT